MRWMAPWFGLAAVAALVALAPTHTWALVLSALIGVGCVAAFAGFLTADRGARGLLARLCSFAAFGVASNLAVLDAWFRLARGFNPPVWEPTRRTTGAPATQ